MQRAEDILAETEKEVVSPLRSPSARGLLAAGPASPSTAASSPSPSPSPSPAQATAYPFIPPPSPPALPATTSSAVQPTDSPPAPSPSLPAAIPATAGSQGMPTPESSPRFDPIPTSPPPEQSANEHTAVASPALPVDYNPEKYPKGRVNFDYVARSENVRIYQAVSLALIKPHLDSGTFAEGWGNYPDLGGQRR